jgi:hypothetical protein
MSDNINLYTHKALNDFVTSFKKWFDASDNPLNPNSNSPGNEYEFMSFVPSPEAIYLIDVGRMPLNDVSDNFRLVQSSNSSGNTVQSNTPVGWKMQLGKLSNKIRSTENEKINNKTIKIRDSTAPGLFCQVIKLPVSDTAANALSFDDIEINQMNFHKQIDSSGLNWIDLFQQPYELDVSEFNKGYLTAGATISVGNFSSLNYVDINKDYYRNYTISPNGKTRVTTMSEGPDPNWIDTSFIGMECFGHFKPSAMGNFSFNIDAGTDFCLLWLGNKSICEYVFNNVDIKGSNVVFKQTFLDDSYIPIRIQFFASKARLASSTVNQKIRKFTVTVTNTDTNEVLDNSKCFCTLANDWRTVKTSNAINSTYIFIPSFVYCAFTSVSVPDFKQGKFNCYSFGGLDASYNSFYSYMKFNKKDIFSGINDAVITDGVSVSEFGTLYNGINYTDAYNNSTSLPSKLSVYRIYADIRMGRTFQISKTKYKGKNMMTELSGNVLKLSNDYTEFANYYPNDDPVNGLPIKVGMSNNDCMNKCNTDPNNCSYYYTYMSNGKEHCVTGTNYSNLIFNQIPGPDRSSGSLFIRGSTTMNPTMSECVSNKMGETTKSIVHSVDYTVSNPYYNYTISGNVITNMNDLGDCSSSNVNSALNTYQDYQKRAKDLLYNIRPYEQFQTQQTSVINDTDSNINKLKSIQKNIKEKELSIDQNFKDLKQNILPNYISTRQVLNNDIKYDYSGNVLLYVKDTKIPSRDEQRLIDSSDEWFTQKSLYSLGIITAATMIILAIYLARE